MALKKTVIADVKAAVNKIVSENPSIGTIQRELRVLHRATSPKISYEDCIKAAAFTIVYRSLLVAYRVH